MTNAQAKTLIFIRQHADENGEIDARLLSSYQSRSLEPLYRDGFIRYITCGNCDGCKYRCTCETLRIREFRYSGEINR